MQQQENAQQDTLENLENSNEIFNISKNNANLEEMRHTLDKNLQILKDIGVQEISKTTKLSSTNISHLLEKRYESLSRVHAKGFIQILEREYKVDLSAWMKEYDRICVFKSDVKTYSFNQETSTKDNVSTHKIELDYNINQANPLSSKKPSKLKWLILLGVAIILICAITMHNHNEHAQTNHTQENNPPQTTLKISPTETNAKDDTSTSKSSQSPKESIKEEPEIIYITPKRDIWVEVIDLDDRANSFQKTLKETYLLETNKHRLLLRFGHGNFSLKLGEESRAYNDNKTKRFSYEPQKGLELINDRQYKKLQQ
ncbi:sialidase [Helicobacter cetorum]|uniref:sialidase n=1 Tax=Helicobacter cetorum TaxID=138563 RepID=UPI000CF070E5|nr:sialidase [Helicobacter cetorum]